MCTRPGGIGRFVPCRANHCRLRQNGWEQCGHGLTSGRRETSSVAFVIELLILFRYRPNSAAALLDGVLLLRYCAAGFASRIPTWRLLFRGGVADTVTEGSKELGIEVGMGVGAGACPLHYGAGVDWAGKLGGSWKRVRLTEELKRTLSRVFWVPFSLFRVWKRFEGL